MQASAEFRSNHQILATYKIIKGVRAEADFQMGWGAKLTSPATDVVDLNGDGEAGYKAIPINGDGYRNGGKVLFDEPGFAAPRLSEMERVAQARGTEVLTQDDFVQGLYLETVGAEGKEGEGTPVHQDMRNASQLIAAREPWDPDARFAVDVKAGEFLIYK